MMVALYVVGGLLAIGMIIGDIFSVIKEDFQMAYDTTKEKRGTSMISFVKGETEISHNLPNLTGGPVLLLHAVRFF